MIPQQSSVIVYARTFLAQKSSLLLNSISISIEFLSEGKLVRCFCLFDESGLLCWRMASVKSLQISVIFSHSLLASKTKTKKDIEKDKDKDKDKDTDKDNHQCELLEIFVILSHFLKYLPRCLGFLFCYSPCYTQSSLSSARNLEFNKE